MISSAVTPDTLDLTEVHPYLTQLNIFAKNYLSHQDKSDEHSSHGHSMLHKTGFSYSEVQYLSCSNPSSWVVNAA